MSWDNYGSYWHIDHLRPCISFDQTNSNDQKECFNWSNLQPLEKSENISKGSKRNEFEELAHQIKAIQYYDNINECFSRDSNTIKPVIEVY